MSATLMGAVLNCGPKKGSMRYALVAIADNSDDYGFACPSIETIAQKACCEARTAMRLVQALERDGWVKVVRRVLFGKGSVYFIDIAKLGVTVNPKMRMSPLHVEVTKMLATKIPSTPVPDESGDNLSREDIGASGNSGDNPQGVQVTKEAESGDKKPLPILINRCEPLLNPNNNPLPPSQANGVQDASGSQSQRQEQSEAEIAGIAEACLGEMVREWNLGFEGVLKLLHQALFDTSLNLGNRRPKHLADGAEEWYRCFESVVVVGCEPHAGSKVPRLIVASKNPAATEGGLKKYHLRIAKGMQQYFGQVVQVRVHSEARRL